MIDNFIDLPIDNLIDFDLSFYSFFDAWLIDCLINFKSLKFGDGDGPNLCIIYFGLG